MPDLDISGLGYSNLFYKDIFDSELHLLQMILNSALRQLSRLSREHFTPTCIDKRFLSIKARTVVKTDILASEL